MLNACNTAIDLCVSVQLVCGIGPVTVLPSGADKAQAEVFFERNLCIGQHESSGFTEAWCGSWLLAEICYFLRAQVVEIRVHLGASSEVVLYAWLCFEKKLS